MKISREDYNRLHLPRQALHHFVQWVDFEPAWMIDLGPGSAAEYLVVKDKWPRVKLIGLEPSPVGYEEARRHWPADGLLFPVAAWDRDDVVRLFKPTDLLHSSCYPDGDSQVSGVIPDEYVGEFIQVVAVTLDTLDRHHGPFHDAILWMDVEGAERRVLKGAEGILRRGAVRIVNVETRPAVADEVAAVLKGHGFEKVYTYFECETVRDEVWRLRKPEKGAKR